MKNISIETIDNMKELKLKLKICGCEEIEKLITGLSDDEKDVLLILYIQDNRTYVI